MEKETKVQVVDSGPLVQKETMAVDPGPSDAEGNIPRDLEQYDAERNHGSGSRSI